ncbi:MAG: lytic murein transglycosylase [Alphaproteobacteria bacterium]|nr:lytic murein transglycosylase [Hyphomonas sp.]MBR9808002.1 lytic murein transglycosylase [Alphaproteobacteria bacterium]
MAQFALRRSHIIAAASLTALLASCAHSPQPPAPSQPPVTSPAPETGPISYESSGHAGMDAWRKDFSARALAAGHDRAVVKSVLTGISPLELWLGSTFQPAQTGIEDQAEFAKPIWDYLRVPMSNSRISTGQARLAENPALFDALEAAYNVDREAIVAIWGMETSFGAIKGNYDGPNVLANMAVEGRRKGLAESELLSLMKILEKGDAQRDDLKAGWAGAMGHTQFMPSTYIAFAQDFDGDGLKDIWNSEADALASAANYLSSSGYALHQPWGIEVLAPTGFDYSLADGNERRMESWMQTGLVPAAGGAFNTNGANYAELWLPAGAEGPKYLLFNNFKVFKTYNNADSYAFAVGLSGDAMGGRMGPVAAWPTHLHPLTVSEIKTLQAALNAKGFDAGVVDGIPGRKTKGALQAFQKSQGLVADGYPTREALAMVTGNGAVGVAVSPGTN